MNISTTNKRIHNETNVQKAIAAYQEGIFSSVRSAALAFDVPPTTLYYRMSGRITRQKAHEHAQNLSDTEEMSLAKLIT